MEEVKTNDFDIPQVLNFDGIGEVTIGTGNNWSVIITALCLMDNPQVNKFLLACKLKLTDRFTKTAIFPRAGMALPNGEVYQPVV